MQPAIRRKLTRQVCPTNVNCLNNLAHIFQRTPVQQPELCLSCPLLTAPTATPTFSTTPSLISPAFLPTFPQPRNPAHPQYLLGPLPEVHTDPIMAARIPNLSPCCSVLSLPLFLFLDLIFGHKMIPVALRSAVHADRVASSCQAIGLTDILLASCNFQTQPPMKFH